MLQKREREFEDYIREKYVQAKADFRALLKETKLIDHTARRKLADNSDYMREIERLLEVRLIYHGFSAPRLWYIYIGLAVCRVYSGYHWSYYSLGYKALSEKLINQLGELFLHGSFKQGRESLGKFVLLLLLCNVSACYNIDVCSVPAKKCALESILFVAAFFGRQRVRRKVVVTSVTSYQITMQHEINKSSVSNF